MKTYLRAFAVVSAVALATSLQAQVTINNIGFGAATTFPAFSISGLNGSLSFQDVLASPAGATLQGGVVQGAIAANSAIGEIFNWGGNANGNVLSAISIIDAGGGGASTYQPCWLHQPSPHHLLGRQTFWSLTSPVLTWLH
jgi:hypothetical protein